MKNRILAAVLAVALVGPALAPAAALAQPGRDDRWQGDRNGGWDPADHYRPGRGHHHRYHDRRLGRDDRIYRGHDGRYYCRRSDGTTGLVIGAVGGGLIGHAIGGDTLGTLLGAGSGALLGREIDRGKVRCR